MANLIEIIIKAVDQASEMIARIETKTVSSSEGMVKSFSDVGIASEAVNKRLQEYGAALDDTARMQNELKQAQIEAQEAAQKLAQAQKNLQENTDPSKIEALNKELVDAQVQLDKSAKEVQNLSKSLRDGGAAAESAKSGFSNMQAAIVTANQAFALVGQVAGTVKSVIDETVGSTVAYAKEVRDLSTNLGISAEETSKIIQASDDYGISVETVTGALEMAVKRGFAPNIETLARLADEYNNISDPVQRAARLSDVFGRNWTALTPILKAGGQAIRDAAAEAEKLGLVLSGKDVQDARNLEIQLDNLNDKVDALKIQIGKGLIPGLTDAADDFGHLIGIVQGTNTPLGDAARNLERVSKAFGENSEVTAAARAEYERLKKQYDDISMNAGERLLRSNTQLIKTFVEIHGGVAALNQGIRNQADVYNVLDAAMNPVIAKQELLAANERTLSAIREQNAVIADAQMLAIQYTESQQKQSEVQAKLDELNKTIEARGPARVAMVKNEKLSTDELAKAQAGLAVAREDLAGVQKKAGETDAEFALRVETLKGKISEYSAKLGEHTAVVGGATKAELEQKAALEGQIAALQKSDEIAKAKGAFDSLTRAFRDGTLSQAQYTERAGALNAITGLYTQGALEQATAQEVLMKSFADPRSEAWRSQLIINKEAIDGVVDSTQKAADKTDELNKKQAEAPKPARAEAKAEGVELPTAGKSIEAAQAALDFTRQSESAAASAKQAVEGLSIAQEKASREMKGNIDQVIGSYKNIPKEIPLPKPSAEPVITPKVDTTQATKDIQSFTTDKIGAVPAEKKTILIVDPLQAINSTLKVLTLFGLIPQTKDTAINVDAKLALQSLDDIVKQIGNIRDKDVRINVNYTTSGNPPEGFQHGVDMIVPPNPRGGAGDYFPFLAAPGERVTVQTSAQQMQNQTQVVGGDTVTYITNVYNPLAAAMLADQQRRDRLARSNARMGV